MPGGAASRHPAAAVPDLAREASPVAHASAAAPPVLLMHGAADDMVPPARCIRLARALSAAGATVELELVPGATHFGNGASEVGGIVRRSIDFLAPYVREAQKRREVRADLDAAQAAEWIARVFFSIAELPSVTFDVHDEKALRRFVRRFLVPGLR